MTRARLPIIVPLFAGAVLMVLLVLPTLVLLLRALQVEFVATLLEPSALEALRLSVTTTAISMVATVLFGTPIAYLLARYRFPGERVLDVLLDLPLVLPPVVAGVGLLLVFGRRGVLGEWLSSVGVDIAFRMPAVVLAQIFVASPLYIRAMKAGFAAVPQRLEAVSLTLGRSRWETFWRVTWPLTLPYLVEGTVLAWARALGEFGATIVFAGSFAGRTQTMPLAIYAALEQDLDVALTLAAVLTLTAFMLLFAFRVVVGVKRG